MLFLGYDVNIRALEVASRDGERFFKVGPKFNDRDCNIKGRHHGLNDLKKNFSYFRSPFRPIIGQRDAHCHLLQRKRKYQSSPKTKTDLYRIRNFQSVSQKYFFEIKRSAGRIKNCCGPELARRPEFKNGCYRVLFKVLKVHFANTCRRRIKC